MHHQKTRRQEAILQLSVIEIVLHLHHKQKKQGGVDKALLKAWISVFHCDIGRFGESPLDPRLVHGRGGSRCFQVWCVRDAEYVLRGLSFCGEMSFESLRRRRQAKPRY